MTWIREQGPTQKLPGFLWNKLAHILVLVFKRQYLTEWQSFFSDLLGLMPRGSNMVDLVLRVCTSIHEELIQRDINRCVEGSWRVLYVGAHGGRRRKMWSA